MSGVSQLVRNSVFVKVGKATMSESNRSASASDIEKFVAETDYTKQRAKEWYTRVCTTSLGFDWKMRLKTAGWAATRAAQVLPKKDDTSAAHLCMTLQAITECARKDAVSALEDKDKLKVVEAEVRVEGARLQVNALRCFHQQDDKARRSSTPSRWLSWIRRLRN